MWYVRPAKTQEAAQAHLSLHMSKCHIVGNHVTRLIIKHQLKQEIAVTRDFQQCGILTCVDSDEPVQPPFKLRNSKYGLVSILTVIKYLSD